MGSFHKVSTTVDGSLVWTLLAQPLGVHFRGTLLYFVIDGVCSLIMCLQRNFKFGHTQLLPRALFWPFAAGLWCLWFLTKTQGYVIGSKFAEPTLLQKDRQLQKIDK